MSEELRDYIEQNRIKTSPVYLQRFHATPPTGWINDPMGLSGSRGAIICLDSSTHMAVNGERCIGDIGSVTIWWHGIGVALR